MTGYVVEVNEANVFTYGNRAGGDWWIAFRRCQPAERFYEHTHTPVGSMVEVACDSKTDAQWLASHMVEHGELNKAAVKVKRAAVDV